MFDEYPHTNENMQRYFSVAVEKYKTRTYEVEEELKQTKKMLADVLSKIETEWDMPYNPHTGTPTGVETFGGQVSAWWSAYKNKEKFFEDTPTSVTKLEPIMLHQIRLNELRQRVLDKLTEEERNILGLK